MVSIDDLRGVHVALATPLSEDGSQLDHDGLAGLVERVVAGGVRAVCPVGSTGEGPRLTSDTRHEVTSAARRLAPAATPIIPAPSAGTAPDAIAEIEGLAAAGADAVLLAPPSYYPMAPDEVRAYYENVADAAAVPIVLYNIPAMTKVAIPPAVVGELAAHGNIAGIKDSSRDFEYLQSVVYSTSGSTFAVLTGSDTMLMASMTVGAVGAVAASANLVPALSRQVYDAVVVGDLDEAAPAQRRLFDVIQACRVGTTPAGWKAALSVAGVCSSAVAAPARALDDDRHAVLAERLAEMGVL